MGEEVVDQQRMFRLLWLIGFCVEFPKKLVTRVGGHPVWNRHVMYHAVKNGYVEVYRKELSRKVIVSLRLTGKGLSYVGERDPAMAAIIRGRYDDHGAHRSSEKILRMHSVATALVMAVNAGAKCLPNEKPSLLRDELYKSHIDTPSPDTAYYYTPQELRKAVEETDPRLMAKTSRMIGAIAKGEDCFTLYDTGNTRMFWMSSLEQNAAVSIQTVLNLRGFNISRFNEVIIGNTMRTAQRLCRREQRYTSNKYFTLSDFYETCYFLPNDAHGDQLLRILLDNGLQAQINATALKGCEPPPYRTRDYDAIISAEERPVSLNYKFDLLRLNTFNPAPTGFTSGPVSLCFDYQVPTMQAILGPSVEVRALKGPTDDG